MVIDNINYKILIKLLVTVFITFILTLKIFANHSLSSDLSYKYINDTTYLISLKTYIDCDANINDSNFINSVGVNIYNYDTILQKDTLILKLQRKLKFISKKDVSIDCGECGLNSIGVVEYSFLDTVSLPKGRWLIKYRTSGRYFFYNIDYGSNPATTGDIVDLLLDNSSGLVNNSIEFSENPIVYSCVGTNIKYKFISEDDDSFIVTPINTKTTLFSVDIPFIQGLSLSYPVQYDNYIHNNTLLSFGVDIEYPNIVSFLISEYRDGTLISYTIRDVVILPYRCDIDSIPFIPKMSIDTSTCLGDTIKIDLGWIPDSTLIETYGSDRIRLVNNRIKYSIINNGVDDSFGINIINESCLGYANYYEFIIKLDTLNCFVKPIKEVLKVETFRYNVLGQFLGDIKPNEYQASGLYIYRIITYYKDGSHSSVSKKIMIIN